jgi:hypothetical protein
MKLKELFLIMLCVVVITAVSFILFYSYYMVLQVREIKMQLTIGDHIGFNVDTDALYFGTIPPGGIGNREIHIKNENYTQVKVNIKIFGPARKWIQVTNNNFILKKGESKDITFYSYVPKNIAYGIYNGEIKIIFTKF